MKDGRMFITEIAGKMAARGDHLLGYIDDVVIDTTNGLLKYLVLDAPAQASDMTDENGRTVIPVSGMHIEREYVIVDR